MAAIVTKKAPSRPQHAFRLNTGTMAVSSSAPDFGPPSPPDGTRSVRLVKDVLKVGRWKVGYDDAGRPEMWDVTPSVLTSIARDFNSMKLAGVDSNLGKTHGDENLLIHPDDLIAPIDAVKVAGDTLWIASYVTPEQAKYLENPAMKVSVGVVPNWQDGRGKTYSMALVHVAVTDRPVVAGQGPFLALADSVTGATQMDFAALLAALNTLLEALGFSPLPDDTSDVNVVDRLIGVTAAMGKVAEEPEPAGPEVPGSPEGDMSMDMTGVPAAMANVLRKAFETQNQAIKQMSDELAARKQADVKAEQSAFNQKVGQLLGAGVPKSVLDGKLALANKLKSFDLALLDGLTPTLNTAATSKARTLANPNTPNVGGTDPESSRKEVAAAIAKRRGISLEDAMKHVPA